MTIKRIRKIDKTAVEVESERMEDYISYINKNRIKEVQINAQHYLEENLSFLEKCPEISHVYIVDPVIKDYSSLCSLKNLRCLISESPNGELDLSLLTNLEILKITWNKHVKNLNKCPSLKELSLTKYNPKNKNLSELSILKSLERLTLIFSSITSLKGIEELERITHLQFNYMKGLKSFDGIENLVLTLKEIDLSKCKGIESYEKLGQVKSLEKLIIDQCSEIQSLEFITELPNLYWLVFLDTNITDGNLSPCEGINYVAFTNHSHFSHTNEDFQS